MLKIWKNINTNYLGEWLLYGLKAILVAGCIAICVAMCSCKTQFVPVPEYHEIHTHDTINTHDSIYVEHTIREKGDTVFDTRVEYRDRWRDRIVEVVQRDSIPYPVEVQVPVRVRNGYDKFVSWGFWLLFAAILAFAAFKVCKWYFLRR